MRFGYSCLAVAFGFAMFGLGAASAATICVVNKETGRLEPLSPLPGQQINCDRSGRPGVQKPVAVASVKATVSTSPSDASAATPETSKSSLEAATDPVPAVSLRQEPGQAWQVMVRDKSVRVLLERWAGEAGYQLLWEVPVDLELNANATIHGTFEDALNSVLAALATSDYPVEAMMYENRAVRIVKRTPREK